MKRLGRTAMLAAVLLFALLTLPGMQGRGAAPAQAQPAGALVVNFNIAVDQGASNYMQKAASAAISNNYDLVIVMNTPGGLLSDMFTIVTAVQSVQSHGLQVYTYVPAKGMAASAGSYIALATNAIYMGNGSFIGPSTPYVIGGSQSEQQHVQNAMIAYIQALAVSNGYNATAAMNMATNNTAYDASTAASIGLVTGLAPNYQSFLAAVGLSGVPLHSFSEPLYDQFLSFLSNSTVDGIFIVAGFVALAIDFLHRTVFLSVVAVALIALGLLGAELIGAPVVALLLLLMSAVLIFIEVKAGHGIFVIGGVAVGLVGTVLLAGNSSGYSPSPYGLVNYILMGVVGGVLAVCFLYLAKIRKILMSQPKLVDPKRVEGMNGRMITDVEPGVDGVCLIGSEDWTCRSVSPIQRGSTVRVVSYEDGKVMVEESKGGSGTS